MNVLLDAHMLGQNETGNETYVAGLLRGLQPEAGEADMFTVAMTAPDLLASITNGDPRFRAVHVSENPFVRLLAELPALARKNDCDVMHVTYAAPLRSPCPVIVTVHDVAYRPHPEWFSLRDKLILNTGVGLSLRRAAAVLTISEHSMREIARFYGVPAHRMHLTCLAADERFSPAPSPAHDFGLPGVKSPYILAVGNLQPRKNLRRLVQAFARLAAAGRPENLVIAGKALWKESDVVRAARDCGVTERVVFTGYVPDKDLPALYRGASLFVFPSLYEGFGLPVLEAMSCGTPVAASSAASVPEVAGDAAAIFDPMNVNDILKAMLEVLSEPAIRDRLKKLGLARASSFSWRRTARETLAVYRSIAEGNG